MRSGEPFDLVWITADRQRQRGGEILTAKRARQVIKRKTESGGLSTARRSRRVHGGSGMTGVDAARGERKTKIQIPPPTSAKNPNHYAHGTRNIRLATNKVRKVHIQLIDSINGQKVV